MNSAAILKTLKQTKAIKARIRSTNAKIKRLHSSVEKDYITLQKVEGVKVVRGLPINVWKPSATSYNFRGVADEHKDRWAEVHRNANDKKFYGVTFYRNPGEDKYREDVFAGCEWKSLEKAIEAAYDWVFDKKLPRRNGEETGEQVKFWRDLF